MSTQENNTTIADDSMAKMVSSIDLSAPIGLFDSGVGGLSVYTHLKQTLPNETYIYYADLHNVPYGTRSSEEITHFTVSAIDWLVKMGCKLVVIACNSASAHALEIARGKHPDVPIVGLVPALKPAVLNSQTKNVAVLATQATLNGALLNDVIREYAVPAAVNVFKCFKPNLVPWVESGMQEDCATALELRAQLHEFAAQRVDHLVLGCTHYPFFKDFIEKEVATHHLGISIIDSGAAIASRVKALLSAQQHIAVDSDPCHSRRSEPRYYDDNSFQNSSAQNSSSQDKSASISSSLNDSDNIDGIKTLNPRFYFGRVHTIDSINTSFASIKDLIPKQTELAFFTTATKDNLDQTADTVRRLVGGSHA